jgi:hypothetical protein
MIKKYKIMYNNIKFFIPLLLRNNPFFILFMLLDSIFTAVAHLFKLFFIQQLIVYLMEQKNLNEIIKFIVLFGMIFLLINIFTTLLNILNQNFAQKAANVNMKLTTLDHMKLTT